MLMRTVSPQPSADGAQLCAVTTGPRTLGVAEGGGVAVTGRVVGLGVTAPTAAVGVREAVLSAPFSNRSRTPTMSTLPRTNALTPMRKSRNPPALRLTVLHPERRGRRGGPAAGSQRPFWEQVIVITRSSCVR